MKSESENVFPMLNNFRPEISKNLDLEKDRLPKSSIGGSLTVVHEPSDPKDECDLENLKTITESFNQDQYHDVNSVMAKFLKKIPFMTSICP